LRRFFLFALVYAACGFLIVAIVSGDPTARLTDAVAATAAFALTLGTFAAWFLPLFLVLPLAVGVGAAARLMPQLGYAAAGTVLLQVGSSFAKSAIPAIVPFYADPVLADLSFALNGGQDDWQIAYRLVGNAELSHLLAAYLPVWSIPAIGLPVLLSLADRDSVRVERTLGLYIFVWIGLGNLVALAASSVGPVFYDALLGGDRFAGLHARLAQVGVTGSMVSTVQDYLWQGYADGTSALGSGISAFPSVHVAMATLTCIYLAERRLVLLPVGVGFVATVQLVSVLTGYHYAVDGYAAIVLVVVAWVIARRLGAAKRPVPAPRPNVPDAPELRRS
jgi:hypothetical protein